MNAPSPKVSVSMLAYNVEKFIAAAIEGVLRQQVDFPFELIIAEDCSTDDTRRICDEYASRYPEKIIVLPSDINRGIPGNSARVFAHCSGEYIAICDSDDIWIDPTKLQRQVAILDTNPRYGVVYTDVEIIFENGEVAANDNYDDVRRKYKSGRVFADLLIDNFINNSTSVFRRSLIADYTIDPDRSYSSYDYLFWLHVASQTEIFFLNEKTTQYRRHATASTSSNAKLPRNRKKHLQRLPSVLIQFEQLRPWTPSPGEKMIIFQKLLSVLYRIEANARTKLKMLGLLRYYFPGMRILIGIFVARFRRSFTASKG